MCIGSCCQVPRTYCYSHSHPLNICFSTHKQTHTHWAQLVLYVCWGQAKGSHMKRPIYTARLGDARSWSASLCVRPSHTAWPMLRGHHYNSPFLYACIYSYLSGSVHLVAPSSHKAEVASNNTVWYWSLSVWRLMRIKFEIMHKMTRDVDIFSSVSWMPPKANVMSGYFWALHPISIIFLYLDCFGFHSNSRKWNATLTLRWSLLRHSENVKFSTSNGKTYNLQKEKLPLKKEKNIFFFHGYMRTAHGSLQWRH